MTHQISSITPRRYMAPLDEAALFSRGATAWRTDISTYKRLQAVIDAADWLPPPDHAPRSSSFLAARPVGRLDDHLAAQARAALQDMLNDPSLVPNLRMMGMLVVGGVELQNGALDENWHHDGLAGKRHGHAGDFFCITYFSEPQWDDAWGGHFEFGSRQLGPDWPMQGFTPEGEIHRIAPAARTTLLGWNQNPCHVHRSAPLAAARDRVTLIASVSLVPRS